MTSYGQGKARANRVLKTAGYAGGGAVKQAQDTSDLIPVPGGWASGQMEDDGSVYPTQREAARVLQSIKIGRTGTGKKRGGKIK